MVSVAVSIKEYLIQLYSYFQNIEKENTYFKFALKNNDTRNKFLEEIMNKEKKKKNCKTLNYDEHLLIIASTTTGCVSISSFASVTGIFVRIKKHMSMKKKRKKHDKIVFFAKTKLNKASKALNESYISHVEFISINNVLKEYEDMKEKIKNPCK